MSMRKIADKPQERKPLTLKEFIIKSTVKYRDINLTFLLGVGIECKIYVTLNSVWKHFMHLNSYV